MRIVAKRTLYELAERYGDCTEQCAEWYRTASKAIWQSLAEVRVVYPHADFVDDKTVFNIKGNHYRLITYISYRAGAIFIKDLLTHAEYDRGKWKES